MIWKNRIVGTASVPPQSLTPNSKNPRRHPSRQRRALLSAIGEVGVIQDVIVNQRTGKLLDGHLRLELAIAEKQAEIPVKYVDLSESEEALVLATFDPVGSLAFLDLEEMSQLQSELAPNLDSPLAELIDRLSPDPVRDDVSHPPGPPSPRDPDSVGSTDDPGPAPEATDEPEQYLLRTPVRVIPMTHDEYRRLSDAFISYQESRGMWFGFVRWLCT